MARKIRPKLMSIEDEGTQRPEDDHRSEEDPFTEACRAIEEAEDAKHARDMDGPHEEDPR